VTTEWPLEYGLNPHQGDARAAFPDGKPWLEALNGQVGYINLLDALKTWGLARELAKTLGSPSAASIKHVHPAGAAVARPLDEAFRAANQLDDENLSSIGAAYARARGGDRIASFGEFIGLSEPVAESCARLITTGRRSGSAAVSRRAFTPLGQRARRPSSVAVIAQPRGSKQDATVTEAADRAGIAMVHTGLRLFWH